MHAHSTRSSCRSSIAGGLCTLAAFTVVPGCIDLSRITETTETVLLNELNLQLQNSELSRQQDPDQDGLSTQQEEQVGTNPRRADTDGDSINDRTELLRGTDPNTPRRDHTVDGVPTAFEGLIEPGASRVFFRGPDAVATAYVRIMGLVRRETTLRIDWAQTVGDVTTPVATTQVTMQPRQYWSWGHDLGPAAIVNTPAKMTVTQLTITVEDGGDSVFYSFISSFALGNGPRGLVPFPPPLANATYDFNLLLAHGAFRDASGWDSFVLMLERIAPELQVIRTSVEPNATIPRRAGQLSRFVQREQVPSLYVIAHSQGGLDTRYILTKAAFDDPHYSTTAEFMCGLYTLGTPHYGLMASPDNSVDPSEDVINWLNESFDGDITIGERVIPVVALVFQANFVALNASDGIVKLASQAFGDHVINDIPSTRGAGPGAGRHVASVPARADVEQDSYQVLGRILVDILARRAATDDANPCPTTTP